MPRTLPSRLWRNRDGAATVMLAISLTSLMGAAAVGVDVGAVFLAKRQLQGIADAAVLAAATGDMASAQSVIDQSGQPGVAIKGLTPGTYLRDAAIAPAARFVATATQPSAARLTLERPVPIFFGRFLTGKPTMMVRAQATAARMDMAAFSIGTRLAALSGGLPNQLLSALAGTELNLSVLDSQGLASTDVDVLGFADALRVQLGRQGSSSAELFGSDIPLQSLVRAMAETVPDAASRAVLAGIAPRLGGGSVRLADMIDLGPMGQNDAHASAPYANDGRIKVDAFSFLRALLEGAQGNIFTATLDVAVPGLAGAKLTIVSGSGTAHSPWLTVTQARDVVIRTSRARLYLDVRVLSGISGIASLRLPVFVDLAEAQARLSDIRCNGDAASDGVTLAVTPSIGSIALADITPAQLEDFSTTPELRPAVLANVLGTRVNAKADLQLGGVTAQSVHFSRDDIANHTPRTVSTHDLTGGIAASLAQNVDVSVTILGITTRLGPLVGAVGSQLRIAAPLVDGLLNQVTTLMGVQLGSATVRVDRMRCGAPMLVA